jgi:molybdopterin-biosynthesis enzyme MoeA-like protein
VHFGLIVVGDEILSGKRQDKHFAKVVELLAARGLALSWARTVGDDRLRLVAMLRETFACTDTVFCCGGIGATPDDHTRQAAAQALGVPLALHPEAARLIAERTAQMAAEGKAPLDPQAPENRQRLKMGEFPEGARIVPNPFNRIPGFAIRNHWFVPGFPVMAWPMIEWALDQRYADLQRGSRQVEHSVIVFGAMEATLTPLMEDIEARFPGIKVFSLPSVDHPQWGRHIELGVKGAAERVPAAFAALRTGLEAFSVTLGPEMVR